MPWTSSVNNTVAYELADWVELSAIRMDDDMWDSGISLLTLLMKLKIIEWVDAQNGEPTVWMKVK